jgi:hypothetical protein
MPIRLFAAPLCQLNPGVASPTEEVLEADMAVHNLAIVDDRGANL